MQPHQQNPDQDLELQLRQLGIEGEAHNVAAELLLERMTKAEQRQYASSTVYGRSIINGALSVAAEHIATRFKGITNGRAGTDYSRVRACLEKLDPAVIALITLKVAIDRLGRTEHKQLKLSELVSAVGHALHTESRLSEFRKQNRRLFNFIRSNFHSGTGTRQKDTVTSLSFRKRGYVFNEWSKRSVHAAGLWAVKMLIESTGLIEIVLARFSLKKTVNLIKPTETFLELRDALIAGAERFAFCCWPMVCKPKRWDGTTGQRGGYLTEELNAGLNRRVNVPTAHSPIAAINALQDTAWRINQSVLRCSQELAATFTSVGSFRCEEAAQVLNWLTPQSSAEDIARYKLESRKTHDRNATLYQRNYRTKESLKVATRFAREERLYFPHFFDFRGRIYCQTTALTTQGTDYDKSLLLFADEGPVNEYWLAFQVATTFGLDKAPFNERVDWTRSKADLISLVVSDPAGTVHLWGDASEPWCFLAACIEFYECCIAKTRSTSGLPIGIDATCSGLQHLSALTLDAAAGAQVNLTPAPKPGDAYRIVAETALPNVPEVFRPHMDRRLTKRTVMTLPYGLSKQGARNHLEEALEERGVNYCSEELTQLVEAVYCDAIPSCFPGAVRAMEWLQDTALETLNHRDTITWTTPSGFRVVQDERVPGVHVIETQILGIGRIKLNLADGTHLDVDTQGHRDGIAPNFIHSLDASLIHLTLEDWERPISTIHDCVLSRSCDMDDLSKLVRTKFVEMYKTNPLQQYAEEQQADLPEGLVVGDLDLEQVLESEFFFC
jgi:DNA-directed RNA polymerase